MNIDLTYDWLLLYLQIFLLLAISGREFFRKKGKNLYAIFIPLVILVLVEGQSWYVLDKFEKNDFTKMRHLYQDISLDGARLANLYIFLSIICLVLTYMFFSLRRKNVVPEALELPDLYSGLKLRDFAICALVLIFGWMVINTSGGVKAMLTKPGQTMVHGLVMSMMLLSLGKIPFLHNIAIGKKNNRLTGFLFLFVIFIFLFNSRFLTVFILMQMIILFHYCRREISKKTFFSVGIVFFLIFIVYGLYRDLSSATNLTKVDNIFSAFLTHFDKHNIFEWFYGLNVEGFAGLAGLLTFEAKQGGISHDFGFSGISAMFQFIPSSLRFSENLPFNDMRDFFLSLYPYHGSVVPSGMENSYANFGLLGVLGLGTLLGYLMQWMHEQMLNPKAKRLLIAIVSVHVLQLIRGSFYNTIFFGLSEVFVLFIYLVIKIVFQYRRIYCPCYPQSVTIGREQKKEVY